MKGTVSCMSLAKWRAGKRRASEQGWPQNAFSTEISSPDKAGTLVSHSLMCTSASTVLAGCGFRLTCNSPGTKNKLDLESVPLLQMGVIDDYLVRTGPKLGLESGGALEFLIPASGDDYLYLSHCYLYIKCRDIKAYGSHIDTLKADVPRVQTLLWVPWTYCSTQGTKGIGYESSPGGHEWRHIPLEGYLMTPLCYVHDAKETILRHLEGRHMDEEGKYDAQENVSLIIRLATIASSQLFDFKGRLHSGMLLQEWLVPNNMNVWLVLSLSQPAFHLMDFGGKPESLVHIEDAILVVCKVKVAPSDQLRHGEGPDGFGGQIPASPCGHQAHHPRHRGQHGQLGCVVNRTNSYQGHHRPN